MNSSAAPLATSIDYSSRGLCSWILRLALVVQCAALALQIGSIQSDGSVWIEQGSWINTYLVGHAGISENIVATIDRVAVYALWACCALILIWPCWPVLIPLSAWVLLNTLSQWYWAWYVDAETHGPATLAFTLILALTEKGLPILVPLALWLLWPKLPPADDISGFRRAMGFGLLRIGLAASFASIGFLAIGLDPYFKLYATSLLKYAPESWGLTEAHVIQALKIMGAVNLVSAAAVLILRLRMVAIWMTAWLLVTAVIYLLQIPWNKSGLWLNGLERLALHAALLGAPLALWARWQMEAGSEPIPLAKAPAEGGAPVPAHDAGPGFLARWALRGTALVLLGGLALAVTVLMGRGGAFDVSQILAQTPLPASWAQPIIAASTPPPPKPRPEPVAQPASTVPVTAPVPPAPSPDPTPSAAPPVPTKQPSVDPAPTRPQTTSPDPLPAPEAPRTTPPPAPRPAPAASQPVAIAPRLRERPVAGRAPVPPPPAVAVQTPPTLPPAPQRPVPPAEEPPSRGGGSFFGIPIDGAPGGGNTPRDPAALSKDEEKAMFQRLNQAAGYVQNDKLDLGEKVLNEIRSELSRRRITHEKLESAVDRLEKTIDEKRKTPGK